MPAKSQAQRAYLRIHFGDAWVKEHGFDNKGKLPQHVKPKGKKVKAKTKAKARTKARKKVKAKGKVRRKVKGYY